MRNYYISFIAATLLFASGLLLAEDKPTEPADWSFTASTIEASSSPMSGPWYYAVTGDARSISDNGNHFCRFNDAFLVKRGHWGDAKLDGLKFWMAGDLGPDFSKGEMDWAVLHFEASATPEQRKGIQAILGKIFPVKWRSLTVGDDLPIEWDADKDRADARLDGGSGGQIILRHAPSAPADPAGLPSPKFWIAPANQTFVPMSNRIEAYRIGKGAFEFKGNNGFVATIDVTAADVKAAEHR